MLVLSQPLERPPLVGKSGSLPICEVNSVTGDTSNDAHRVRGLLGNGQLAVRRCRRNAHCHYAVGQIDNWPAQFIV
jgi:hypothetical protein